MKSMLMLGLCVGLSLLAPASSAGIAAMSVDFGDQFIKIGLVKPGVPMEIVLNRESHRKSPAIVAFRGGERSFSETAAHVLVKFPKDAYTHLVDLLGKKWDNPIVALFRQRFPFYQMEEEAESGVPVFVAGEERYSVVELVGMILAECKSMTEAYAEQSVKDVVVAVPPYWNQAERRAMADAARVAGLNLLQLINDNAAVALNYGAFRRKQFNESASHVLVFDMGASKTTATVLEYQLVKDKTSGEKAPQVTVVGFGYDRTLGGLEMTLRLRDHLLKNAEQMIKTEKPLRENARAMGKLFKEAERLKLVLSANADFIAQIENLAEDKDFKLKVTRDEFELPSQDLWDRIRPVIDQALGMAEMTVDQMDTILLFGGATRVPMVQLRLKENLGGREPARFLNTDEAVALGAVYQAAHLSAGFKVLKFGIRDANIHPIAVDFQKEVEAPGEEPRTIHRTLFGMRNPFPQKKVMTFSKHRKDFAFSVAYTELERWMKPEQLAAFGERKLTEVKLGGVQDAAETFAKEEKDGPAKEEGKEGEEKEPNTAAEWKGIKAHFRLDDSGLLHIDTAEVIVERTGKDPEEESTLSKIAGKLSGLFSGSEEGADGEGKDGKAKSDEDSKEGEEATEDAPKGKKDEEKKDEEKKEDKAKSGEKANATAKDGKAANSTKEAPKPRIVKTPLAVSVSLLDQANATDAQIAASRAKLEVFEAAEKEKAAREGAQNALESFVYETKDRLDQTEYSQLVEAEELGKIKEALAKAGEWAEDEAGFHTKAAEYEEKLTGLKELTKDLFYRHEEAKERPRASEALTQMLNYSTTFLAGVKNLTEDTQMFTEKEIEVLQKLITDTEEWREKKEAEQGKLKPHQDPALTLRNTAEKIQALDREVKYMLNKAKTAKPLKPPKEEPAANATAANETTTDDAAKDGDAKAEEGTAETGDEKAAEGTAEEDASTTTDKPEETTTHTADL